jgi:dipeptidyl aminopeptidase/acylaminoacyl peptidase
MSIRKFSPALAAALLLLAPGGRAQSPDVELIPRPAFFGNPTRTQALVSPDGRWLSWLAPTDGVQNIWVAPVSEPDKGRSVTDEKVRPIRQHFWAQDSTQLLFINDSGGDENFLLYGVPPQGGRAKNYTPFQKTRVILVGDSRARPGELLIGLNNRNPQYHDVHRLNLETGELTLVYQNDQFGGFHADDRLELRFAFKEKPGGGMDVLRFDKGQTSPFSAIPPEDSITTSSITITADGKTLYWIDSRGRDKAALVAQEVGAGATRVVAESTRGDVREVLLNPKTLQAEAYSLNDLKNEGTPIGNAVEADIAAINRQVPGQWSVGSRDRADTLWVLRVDDVTRPISYQLYDRKTRTLKPLFITRPELDGKPLAPMYGREIRARDGLTLTAFLTLPLGADPDGDGKPARPLPLVLNVHGGPWAQDVFGYHAEAQWMANRGYAVLQVNYRGSTGFGKQFVEAANREFAGKMHDDLIDAVKWAVDGGIAPADKVAIYGGSYGGYATLVGLTFTPATFACGVDIVGPSSLVTLIESFPEYWKPFLEGTWYRRVGNPSRPADREFLLTRSPITRIAEIRRPLLIAQGANDPRVTQKESDQIVAAMLEKKIPVTYVVYADEGHGFARPENRISFYGITEGFLSKCLGGRFEPLGDFKGAKISVPQGADLVPGLAQAIGSR